MASSTQIMPIGKELITNRYYRWWLDICKLINPNNKQSLRFSMSIIEAYRCDLAYLTLRIAYNRATRQENFSQQQWTAKYLNALERYMDIDKKRIHRISVSCPNLLICIAGVVNGIHQSSNIKSVIKTILLLDIIDDANIDLISEIEMNNICFLQKSTEVFVPLLKEPEIYSIVSFVEKLLESQPSLQKLVEEKYAMKSDLISRTLGIGKTSIISKI